MEPVEGCIAVLVHTFRAPENGPSTLDRSTSAPSVPRSAESGADGFKLSLTMRADFAGTSLLQLRTRTFGES